MAATAAPSAASVASVAGARLLASAGAGHPQELQARQFGWRQAVADRTGASMRLGWHLAVKCVAALVPPLRRHHTSRLGPLLAPRVAEDRLLAEDDLLAEDHRLASADDLLARNVDQLLILLLLRKSFKSCMV